jgi:putative nucleotidyltransferase with HDIG domain
MIDLKSLKSLSKEYKVLYVEDDKSIQVTMANYLRKFFLKVVSSDDGMDGLKLYKKNKYDIVITDLSMPKMDGLDMIEEIRKIDKNQTILITSAHSETKYMVRAIKAGIDGYIIKPFEYEQLNYELFKIVEKLKKFAENENYKKYLKRMVEQKTSELNSMIHFQKYNYDKTLLSMVEMIEDRDTYTAGHSERVANYSKMIAKEMGYDKNQCEKIYQAGILHDIGKIATPDVILLKPKSLNEIEYKLIKEHVEVGHRLLIHIPMFKDLAEIVYSHHERYDGKGYPRGLKADEIMPLSRVMIVADAFDAMTTNRIYKGRKTLPEAIRELKKLKAIQFHPEVVDSAVKVLKNIHIDNNINQLPHTEIEKERFAYFYKDTLCDVYNQNYLDLVLTKNSGKLDFKYMYMLSLKGFTEYNQKFGWADGDEMLKKIALKLKNGFKDEHIFRVFGDDFILLSKDILTFKSINDKLKDIVNDRLDYHFKMLSLNDMEIENIKQIAI